MEIIIEYKLKAKDGYVYEDWFCIEEIEKLDPNKKHTLTNCEILERTVIVQEDPK